MPFRDIVLVIVIVGVAYAVTLPTWFVLHKPVKLRTLLLGGQLAVLFSLPWLYPATPVALKAMVTLATCAAIPPKLIDANMRPDFWHGRALREWLFHMLIPFVLVPRLHLAAPKGLAAASRPALRGVVETALGGVILWLAFRFEPSQTAWTGSFWFEHAVKLVAAYLLVFDGGFLLATAITRLIDIRTLDLSRDPVLATTPADFWRRYNCEASRFLREDVFFPLGGRRRPILVTILTFQINGVLHEYLSLVMVGRALGYQYLFFTLHGFATALTLGLRPRGRARLLATAATVLFLYFTSILFFATVNQLVPWYSHDVARLAEPLFSLQSR